MVIQILLLDALYLTYDSCYTPIIDKTVCLENQTQLGSQPLINNSSGSHFIELSCEVKGLIILASW